MSGGAFDYLHEYLPNLADAMENWLNRRSMSAETEAIPLDIVSRVGSFADVIRKLGEQAREIELYASGDTGEDRVREALRDYQFAPQSPVIHPWG